MGPAHAGSEYESDGNVFEIPGAGAGKEVEFPEIMPEFLVSLVRHVSCV